MAFIAKEVLQKITNSSAVKHIAIGAGGQGHKFRAGQNGHSYSVHMSNSCGLVAVGFLHHN